MSRIVEDWPPPNGFARKYEWSKWADGNIHELTRGEDFEVDPYSFKHAALKHAEKNGLRFSSTIRGGRIWIRFLFAARRAS